MFMILCLSLDDIVLYVRQQQYEPNISFFFFEKQLHFVRNYGSKVTSGDTETETALF
jgi:hypothetical protein